MTETFSIRKASYVDKQGHVVTYPEVNERHSIRLALSWIKNRKLPLSDFEIVHRIGDNVQAVCACDSLKRGRIPEYVYTQYQSRKCLETNSNSFQRCPKT